MSEKNYWGYRIDTGNIEYFTKELNNGNLRQGWGYLEGQNLNNFTVDEGAGRNKAMLKVKKGDILLIPRLPDWDSVTIAEATEDWEKGYKFEIDKKLEDYGHIFPAKKIKSFVRTNVFVDAGIRTTLKCVGRFWNITHLKNEIDKIIETKGELSSISSEEEKFKSAIESTFFEIFKEKELENKLFNKFVEKFQAAEWENALVFGLQLMFPQYIIEKIGGTTEKEHGTDILIKIPDLFEEGKYYGIAIQVKDYNGIVGDAVVAQIQKADQYFSEKNEVKLIEKIILMTKAEKESNEKLIEKIKGNGIKVIFASDLKKLLVQIGITYISQNPNTVK